MTTYSLLDLVPIVQGSNARTALANAADLARHAEAEGFARYWCAEHHGMAGIASAATSVVIGHVAAATSTIRVGAGGIMLPNHAPLQIAEQFGTLDALFPGRIDLGLGRAPGSDQRVAYALRRTLNSDPDAFPQDVVELQSYLADDGRTGIVATPGAHADVRLWILGSSTYGAQVAAALGLPYAFASHFAPQQMSQAIELYRHYFKPSAVCAKPYLMLGFNVIAAPDDAEAAYLATSAQQSMVAMRTTGPIRLPPPVENYRDTLPPQAQAILDSATRVAATGGPDTVRRKIEEFVASTGADELMLTSSIYDHGLRKRSLSIAAAAMREVRAAA